MMGGWFRLFASRVLQTFTSKAGQNTGQDSIPGLPRGWPWTGSGPMAAHENVGLGFVPARRTPIENEPAAAAIMRRAIRSARLVQWCPASVRAGEQICKSQKPSIIWEYSKHVSFEAWIERVY